MTGRHRMLHRQMPTFIVVLALADSEPRRVGHPQVPMSDHQQSQVIFGRRRLELHTDCRPPTSRMACAFWPVADF
jgi:hypothetical protein